MKKFFFLYFLVLSPLIFSQNSYRFYQVEFENIPVFNENILKFSANNLIIVDRDYNKKNKNSWLINPIDSSLSTNKENFSSLLLVKQLEEINHKTPFEISHNPTLERYIRVFLTKRRESLSKLLDKSSYYFPIFEEYLDKYDLPLEIKYLAIVESALNPNANSVSGAKGLWQFMYSTGKQYNLQVNSYIDDRFDPIKSTEAACKYLKSLYRDFNDWDLALAAYNSGPGNVRKAIKRSGGNRNYWEIRQFLPQETRGYLPAFYATYYIFEYAKTHDLNPIKSTLTYFETDTVHIKKQITFTDIQKYVPIKIELLKALNPQYKRETIPFSKNQRFTLTLPDKLISIFVENENFIYQMADKEKNINRNYGQIKISKLNSYIVQKGDNLRLIANRHQITLSELKNWNGLHTDYLIAGQRLVITNKDSSEINSKRESFPNNKIVKTIAFSQNISPEIQSDSDKKKNNTYLNEFETYIVKEGDTLFNISRKYHEITISQIRDWNNILDIRYLKPGTRLKIYNSQ
jgi:membrane-bound lytic murein transglycosylase D